MRNNERTPPGPKGRPLIGSALEYGRDPLAFLQRMHREFPRVARIGLGFVTLDLVTDPELVEELLVGKHRECVKDRVTRELIPLVGHSVLTTDGDPWRKRRRLAAAPFAPKQLTSYADTMVDCAERHVAQYQDGEGREFHEDVMALTLEVVGKTMLGFDPVADAAKVSFGMEAAIPHMEAVVFSLVGQLANALPFPLPSRTRSQFVRGKRVLDGVVGRIVAQAQNAPDEADYMLARLARARDEHGLSLTPEELAHEAITYLLAGHETTALTLLFSVYLLSEHPKVAARVRSEIDEVLDGRPVEAADLPRLPLLHAVLKEALRLYPAAPIFGREVAVPLYLDGYEYLPGATLAVSPFAMQRDPRFYAEPERFNPDRYLDGACDDLPKYAYFPFGGGPRVCIGQHFAMMEAALLLATLLRHVELHVRPGFEMSLVPVITLRSAHGLPVIVKRRTPARRPEVVAAE